MATCVLHVAYVLERIYQNLIAILQRRLTIVSARATRRHVACGCGASKGYVAKSTQRRCCPINLPVIKYDAADISY